jgi:hypothetical protein
VPGGDGRSFGGGVGWLGVGVGKGGLSLVLFSSVQRGKPSVASCVIGNGSCSVSTGGFRGAGVVFVLGLPASFAAIVGKQLGQEVVGERHCVVSHVRCRGVVACDVISACGEKRRLLATKTRDNSDKPRGNHGARVLSQNRRR